MTVMLHSGSLARSVSAAVAPAMPSPMMTKRRVMGRIEPRRRGMIQKRLGRRKRRPEASGLLWKWPPTPRDHGDAGEPFMPQARMGARAAHGVARHPAPHDD